MTILKPSNQNLAAAQKIRVALMVALLLASKQATLVAAWARHAPCATTRIKPFLQRPSYFTIRTSQRPKPSRLFHSCSTFPSLSSSLSDRAPVPLSSDPASSTATDQHDDDDDDDDDEIRRAPRKFVAYPFEYHRELEIRIETLTNLGMGIARVDLSEVSRGNVSMDEILVNNPNDLNGNPANNDHANAPPPSLWVVMVPNVIPGELVKARIFRNHRNYSEADLIEILEPSPGRVEPQCPLAGECGGCQYQHMPIGLQREWKTKHVLESFQQLQLTSVAVQPALGTDHIYHYRSKITPHYQAPAGGGKSRRQRRKQRRTASATTPSINDGVEYDDDNTNNNAAPVQAIGFQRSNVRQIIDVPSCPIATPPLNEEYQKTRQRLLNEPFHKELGATLLFRQANLDDDYVVTDHKEHMTTLVNGISFTYLAGNFFQNNLHVLPLMVSVSMDWASQPDPTTGDKMTHFVDCYCGSGLFCLSAAAHFDVCTGIEINSKAVEEARQNAKANGLPCTFEAARAEQIFDNPNVQTFPRDATVVMLDPPRKGCDTLFLKQLEAFRPQRIVYMSCNPATQARDAKEMVSWGYEITFVQPFDLFPQTRHIECLAVLERIN